jgi:hypothetical protein
MARAGKAFVEVEMIPVPLRDWFAASALEGILADPELNVRINSEDEETIERERNKFANLIAKSAYRYADAMLAVRAAQVKP